MANVSLKKMKNLLLSNKSTIDDDAYEEYKRNP
jgi:hypothetical protein